MAEKFNGANLYHIIDNHEERLQRVEDDRVETAAQMAEQTTTLKAIHQSLKDQQSTRKEDAAKFEKIVDLLRVHMDSSERRFVALEKREQSEEKSKDWWRKLVFTIVIGAGGAIGTLILEKLVSH